jgi:hypothetical protein
VTSFKGNERKHMQLQNPTCRTTNQAKKLTSQTRTWLSLYVFAVVCLVAHAVGAADAPYDPKPAQITKSPLGSTILEGGNAVFTVSATGDSLSYRWLRNGTNITRDCRISGTNTSTLVLRKARLSDSGDQFSVVVYNSKNTVTSQAATLTVTPAPSTGPFLYVNDENTVLARIDVRTGNMTPIGIMWFRLTDIAFTPEGTLYGISTNVLYRVNPETAVVSYIASHKVPGANALVCGSDGTLYAASGSTTYLYKINPATGVGEVLGNTGFYSGGDLAFKDGKLYMASSTGTLVHIDLQTFRGTVVGSLGFSRAFGLATGEDCVLYGVAGTNIFSVNTATGAGTLVSEFGGQCLGEIYGTAFFGEAGAAPARVLCNPKRVGNLMQLTLAGQLNRTYAIERSTNLIHWTEVTRVQATNSACILQFATLPGAKREFFRAR